jgi:hypothetical protein
MKTAPVLACVAAVMLAALPVPTADAHLKTGKKRWVFGGATKAKTGGPRKDPINLLFYPNGVDFDTRISTDRLQAHLRGHFRPRWDRRSQMGGPNFLCKGRQLLRFGTPSNKFAARDGDQGAGYGSQPGPFDDCRNRYHSRMWSSGFDGASHSGRQTYVVFPTHVERVRAKIRCKFRLLPCRPEIAGHKISRGWDAVERAMITKMRRRGRGGHGSGHCAVYRWRPLPGSGGKLQGHRSDGWVGRISAAHCANR